MAGQTNPQTRRRGIATAAIAVVTGSLSAVIGTPVPAAADPPPTSIGNVFHGFVLDDDGDFHIIDHPDAGTTVGPGSLGTGTQVSGINNRREDVVTLEGDAGDLGRSVGIAHVPDAAGPWTPTRSASTRLGPRSTRHRPQRHR